MIDHVSDLQWDRLLAGELPVDAGEVVRAHADKCAPCASRLRELTAERDAFLLRPIQIQLSRAPRRQRRWRSPLVPVAAAAIVVTVLILVVNFTMRGSSLGKRAVMAPLVLDPPAPPDMPKPIRMVKLTIVTTPPGATVIEDGVPQRDVTPTTIAVDSAKDVKLILRLAGYDEHELSVHPEEGLPEDNKLTFSLKKSAKGVASVGKRPSRAPTGSGSAARPPDRTSGELNDNPSRDTHPRDDGSGQREHASEHRTEQALMLFRGERELEQVDSGGEIHPGEPLLAFYRATRDGFGAVLSRNGAGAVTAYVPFGGQAMVRLPASTRGWRLFPQTTIVDDVLGCEQVAIVWCETVHPLEPWLDSLRAGQSIAASHGCVVREFTLYKCPGPDHSPACFRLRGSARCEPRRATR